MNFGTQFQNQMSDYFVDSLATVYSFSSKPANSIFDAFLSPAHLIAGAMAGMMEHCAMYPVDSIKVSQHSIAMFRNCPCYRCINHLAFGCVVICFFSSVLPGSYIALSLT